MSATVLLLVSACDHDDTHATKSRSPSTSVSGASSATTSDPTAAEKRRLLARYADFWTAQVTAYGQASVKGTGLTTYATGDALGRAESDLKGLKQAGRVLKGRPRHDATVTGLDMGRKVPDATIRDCLDVSKWRAVDRKTGETLPPATGQLQRYVAVVSAEKWGKRWMITRVSPQQHGC